MGSFDLAPGKNTQRGFWGFDFQLNRRLRPRQIHRHALQERLAALEGYLPLVHVLRVRAAASAFGRALTKPAGPRIWFTPYNPRPWYILWAATVWGGMRFARSPERARRRVLFRGSDGRDAARRRGTRVRSILALAMCRRAKSREVMERAFGYPLAVDPHRRLSAKRWRRAKATACTMAALCSARHRASKAKPISASSRRKAPTAGRTICARRVLGGSQSWCF